MVEVTPVAPTPIVPKIRKVEGDEKSKDNKNKDRQQANNDLPIAENEEGSHKPAQHIDEIV